MFATNKGGLSRLLLISVAMLTLALFALSDNLAHANTITVTTTNDELNSDGDCSLREAVQAANGDVAVDACAGGNGVDYITLSSGTFALSIPGDREDANATGDLDITSTIGFTGAGSAATFVDGASLDRVLHVFPGASAATSDLTIRKGSADSGGGIRNGGNLILINTNVSDNAAMPGNGGGIFNAGQVNLYDSTVSGNRAFAGGGIWSVNGTTVGVFGSDVSRNSATGLGGGLANLGGTLTIDLSTVSENTAGGSAGGIGSFGPLCVDNSTVSGNSAGAGGGVFILSASATIANSTIFFNLATASAFAEGGGGVLNSGSLTVTNSTIVENFSLQPGSGIQNSSQGVTTLRNTIVASGAFGNCGGSIVDEGGNLSWPDSTCSQPGYRRGCRGQLPCRRPALDVPPPGCRLRYRGLRARGRRH
jgi:CSLREA domain-containing protein